MTPPARAQAAIELLDEIIAAAAAGAAAADTLIVRYFKTRRYAGSKDRRAVRELVYAAVRRAGERPASGRTALLGLAEERPALLALFDGTPHAPAMVQPGEATAPSRLLPAWLEPRLDPLVAPDEWPALLARAPLDLRVNRLAGTRSDALQAIPEAQPTPLSPLGLRLPDGSNVEALEAWGSGLVEVQDEGSQLLVLACGAKPGATVIDLCAGAGGTTLALAAEMANTGRLVACDTDRRRLAQLPERATRAGVRIAEQRLLDPGKELAMLAELRGAADLVLVDAPCSGSGTWRRNPETRWRLTPARLEQLVEVQARLLDIAAELVRPGGRLAYAVCSLLADEGRDQAAGFGRRRSSFVSIGDDMVAGRVAGEGRLLTPGHDGTDGFFVARWRAPC